MKSSKLPPAKSSSIKQALLGLYGILGISISALGLVRVPFAEDNAKEHWRHALAGIFIVIALVVGIISLALYMFDANYFKSQMVAYVKTHTHRDLTLEGDIKVSFFPKLGLNSGKMTLSQANSGQAFASIENARLYIAWWPLLRKQLQIESVALDGVHANVIRYKHGGTNLNGLLVSDGSLGDIKFEIDSIILNNASVNFQDETTGMQLSMHDLNIRTGKLADSTPGEMSANFRLESVQPPIKGNVAFSSHLFFELANNHYEFANFDGTMEGEAAGISNMNINFHGNLNSYPVMKNTVIDKLSASAKGMLGSRKLEAKLTLPKLQLSSNKISGETLALNAILSQEAENLSASLELPAFELNSQNMQAENIAASFDLFQAGHSFQGKLSTPLNINFETHEVHFPAIVGSLNGNHPALQRKLAANVSGSLLANFISQNIKIDFKAKIDDSNISGNLGAQNFIHPVYSFDLGTNKLDLDQYLATDWVKRMQDDSLPFDFSGLRMYNFHGKLRCNEFKFSKLKFNSFVAEIRNEQSKLLIEPISARLYNGSLFGSLSIEANETSKISLRQKLSGVQLSELLSDISPGEAKLSGKGNLILELGGTGANMAALRSTLAGKASLALSRGSISGINLTEALLAGKAQLGLKDGVRTELAKFTDTTPFSEFKSNFDISEGHARSNDFLMKSALFSSKGEGEIDLATGLLNYRLNSSVANNLKRNNNGELAELKGISIPIRVNGTYAAPSLSIDFGNASGGNIAKLAKANMAKDAVPETASPRVVTNPAAAQAKTAVKNPAIKK